MEENSKDKIIVITNDQDKKENTWFPNYTKQVARYKYYVLSASLICLIAGYVACEFGYNKPRRNLEASFSISNSFPFTSSNDNLYYPNGNKFNQSDIINSENIKAVLELKDENGNLKYSNLTYDKLINSSSVSISKIYSTSSENEAADSKFTIKLLLKSFSNSEQATSFVKDLVNNYTDVYFKTQTNSLYIEDNLNYYSVENYNTYNDLFEKLVILQNQYNSIESAYNSLIKSSLDSKIGENGKSISQLNNEFKNACDLSLLESSAYSASYLINFTSDNDASKTKTYIENKVNAYIKDYNSNLAKIDSLTTLINNLNIGSDSSSNIPSSTYELLNGYIKQKSTLTSKNLEIEAILNHYGYSYDSPSKSFILGNQGAVIRLNNYINGSDSTYLDECKALVNQFDSLKDELIKQKELLVKSYSDIYSKCEIKFDTPSIGSVTGGVSNYIGAIAGLLLGYVISSLIASYYGKNHPKKEDDDNSNSHSSNNIVEVTPSNQDK